MRITALLGALLVAASAVAQIKMDVTIGGRPAGKATITQKLTADGNKVVSLAMELVGGERTVKVRTESTYKPDGSPIRKLQETSIVGQRYRRLVIATFSADTASVVEDVNGKRSTRAVPLPAGGTMANESEFWFLTKTPAVGAKVKTYSFDTEKFEWELVEIDYVGQQEIKVGGKTVKAHLTKTSKGSAYFDQSGLPVRLELANGRFDRNWEK